MGYFNSAHPDLWRTVTPTIRVTDLCKEFRVSLHRRGTLGALRNLVSREYRTVRAVDGISFTIQRGELVGYLGPNGAGKSTTIKMLTGILVPTSGQIIVNGRVPYRERRAHVARIGQSSASATRSGGICL